MVRRSFLLACLVLPLLAAAQTRSPLAGHPSAYLSMHATDPVRWRLWDEALLDEAEQQNRLIYLSSGYYACHWCHVMQRESFRNEAIAQLLNEHFIPVKIDRELWPEIDGYLLEFTRRTRGHAGWPLNAYITPQGVPLLGHGYLAPEPFYRFLQNLHQRWSDDAPAMSRLAAAAVAREAAQSAAAHGAGGDGRRLQAALLAEWQQQADLLEGGFGQQAKFPHVPRLRALLRLEAADPAIAEFLHLTLQQMASGGLRDQLGGGFFRYAVDPAWAQPHFEKMLIDNAQLARLYLEAGRRWPGKGYRRLGLETLAFMLRQMRHADGGLISALSAVDGEGVDGGYYLWSEGQLEALFGARQQLARALWGMTGSAGHEAGYLPLPPPLQALSGELNLPLATLQRVREAQRRALLAERAKRVLPRDAKRLAAWNGVALSALSHAHDEGEPFRSAGREVRNYLHGLWDGERLWRMRAEGGVLVRHAGLDDYAHTALGLLHWAAVAKDSESRVLARRLLQAAWERFHGEAGWRLAALVPPQRVVSDGVAESPLSVLLEGNRLLGDEAPGASAGLLRAVQAAEDEMVRRPLAFASFVRPLRDYGE